VNIEDDCRVVTNSGLKGIGFKALKSDLV